MRQVIWLLQAVAVALVQLVEAVEQEDFLLQQLF
jgi:hypothetical protein